MAEHVDAEGVSGPGPMVVLIAMAKFVSAFRVAANTLSKVDPKMWDVVAVRWQDVMRQQHPTASEEDVELAGDLLDLLRRVSLKVRRERERQEAHRDDG